MADGQLLRAFGTRALAAYLALSGLLIVAIMACDGGVELDPILPNDSTVAGRDQSAPVQTDGLHYSWVRDWVGWGTTIAFTLQNQALDTVYLLNCNGQYASGLEERVGGAWQLSFGRPVTDCLSPPVVIRPGTIFRDSIYFWAAEPGQGAAPVFPDLAVDGVYRLLLGHLVFHFRATNPTLGDTVPLRYRYSNPFTVRR